MSSDNPPMKALPPSPAPATAPVKGMAGAPQAGKIEHYENFPVASWLCPPRLRPAVAAIYHFARTADDLADEGGASPDERRADLAAYRADLNAVACDNAGSGRWASVFDALAPVLRQWQLPLALLTDLLSAFEQDISKTRYADQAELLDYCRRSANPVGRLLLHLYGVHGDEALRGVRVQALEVRALVGEDGEAV